MGSRYRTIATFSALGTLVGLGHKIRFYFPALSETLGESNKARQWLGSQSYQIHTHQRLGFQSFRDSCKTLNRNEEKKSKAFLVNKHRAETWVLASLSRKRVSLAANLKLR